MNGVSRPHSFLEIVVTNLENKKALDESIAFFEDFINKVLPKNIEGIKPMEVMRHYNLIRNELSKLYVDR